MEALTQKSPFDASMLTRFRKRITSKILAEVNHVIIGRPRVKEDGDDRSGDGSGSSGENDGTLILDAACVSENICFPTDASLLNKDRLHAKAIIDVLHEHGFAGDGPKPRTYRKKAKNRCNSFSKSCKKTQKSIRKAVRQQLGYLC